MENCILSLKTGYKFVYENMAGKSLKAGFLCFTDLAVISMMVRSVTMHSTA